MKEPRRQGRRESSALILTLGSFLLVRKSLLSKSVLGWSVNSHLLFISLIKTQPDELDWFAFYTAKKFGATEYVNPKDFDKPIQDVG